MRNVRRYPISGALYFVTVVTYQREPLLHVNVPLFWDSWGTQQLMAWVILPDHFHALLFPLQDDLSRSIHSFKIKYSRRFRDCYRTGPVWQNRYWDHFIRNGSDHRRHLDYIHYNPVKHGLSKTPAEFPLSSFSHYIAKGLYEHSWGSMELDFDGVFGE